MSKLKLFEAWWYDSYSNKVVVYPKRGRTGHRFLAADVPGVIAALTAANEFLVAEARKTARRGKRKSTLVYSKGRSA